MSEFVKPVRRTVNVRDAFADLLNQELVKDLHDNEDICPVCKGTGVRIEPNRYGLSDDPVKNPMFPYQHQSLSFCPNCYNGIVRYCPDCGKQLTRGHLQCSCEAVQRRKQEKKRQAALNDFEQAVKHDSSALGTEFTMCHSNHFPHNEGYFSDWEEFFDCWDDSDYADLAQRPQYVWGTSEIHMSLDAYDIINSACEDMYDDAVDDIGSAAIKEMQNYFDSWLKTNGRTTYIEDRKHAVRIPWEQYDE